MWPPSDLTANAAITATSRLHENHAFSARLRNVGAGNRVRQLRPAKTSRPDMSREVRVRHELLRGPARSPRHQPDPLAVMLPHEPHRLRDIAVVGHHPSAVIGIEPTVVQQMHGEIDVRALLDGLHDLRHALRPDRIHQGRANRVTWEVPEIPLDLGPVVLKSPEINILALRLDWSAGLPDTRAVKYSTVRIS